MTCGDSLSLYCEVHIVVASFKAVCWLSSAKPFPTNSSITASPLSTPFLCFSVLPYLADMFFHIAPAHLKNMLFFGDERRTSRTESSDDWTLDSEAFLWLNSIAYANLDFVREAQAANSGIFREFASEAKVFPTLQLARHVCRWNDFGALSGIFASHFKKSDIEQIHFRNQEESIHKISCKACPEAAQLALLLRAEVYHWWEVQQNKSLGNGFCFSGQHCLFLFKDVWCFVMFCDHFIFSYPTIRMRLCWKHVLTYSMGSLTKMIRSLSCWKVFNLFGKFNKWPSIVFYK